MNVTLIVSAGKHTGAAAVAEHCCRALRRTGVNADFLFLAGRNLETRLAGKTWAHADLVKERRPRHLFANIAAVRRTTESTDIVLTHLPHDHLLCRLAGVHRHALVVRSFRNRRHLRANPYHRFLIRKTAASLLPHSGLEGALLDDLKKRPNLVLPVPIEDRFGVNHDPEQWRTKLALPHGASLLGMVGKIAAGRGFNILTESMAALPPEVHAVVVGEGEERPALEALALDLGVETRIHWVGYQEEELPALYAAMDVVLFAAPGSDHGHRAISEAQACGRPVVAVDVAGVGDLVEDGVTGRIIPSSPPEIAKAVIGLLGDRATAGRTAKAGAAAASSRRFEPVGRMLKAFLLDLTQNR